MRPGPSRTVKLTFRLGQAQRRELDRLAREAETTPSAYVRETLFGNRPTPRRVRQRDAALHHLMRLIRRLDELIAEARRRGRMPERRALVDVLDQAAEVLGRLLR